MAEAKALEDLHSVEGVEKMTQKEFEKAQEDDPRLNDASRRVETVSLVTAPVIVVDGKPSPHKEVKEKAEKDETSRPLTSAEIASRKLGVFQESDKFADEVTFAAENDPLVNQYANVKRKAGRPSKNG